MENKKTNKADLENKKNIFLEIGLIIALTTMLLAFEWKSPYKEVSDFRTVSPAIPDEEVIPVTIQHPSKPKPPPPPVIICFPIEPETPSKVDSSALNRKSNGLDSKSNQTDNEENKPSEIL